MKGFRSVFNKQVYALLAVILLIMLLAPAASFAARPGSPPVYRSTVIGALLALGLLGAYTASKAQTSQGTLIEVNAGAASPPSWITIGEPLDAAFSDKNVFDDTTNLQSTAREFLPILPDPGKLQVNLNRVSSDAGQRILKTSLTTLRRDQYRVTFPINTAAGQSTQGDTRIFLAYVEELSPDIHNNKKIPTKFVLQITGAITETEGS